MKQTYRVWARHITYAFVDIAAESPEDAMEAARSLGGGDFREDGSDWEFDLNSPYEVDEEPMFTYDEILYPD